MALTVTPLAGSYTTGDPATAPVEINNFTPSNNSLLVLVIACSYDIDEQFETDVSGGGLTWTLRSRSSSDNVVFSYYGGFVEIWTAEVATGSLINDLEVAKDPSAFYTSAFYEFAAQVIEVTGYDTATPIDETVSGSVSNNHTGSFSLTLTDYSSDNAVIAVAYANGYETGKITTGTGWTTIFSETGSSGYYGGHQHAQYKNGLSSTSVTWDNFDLNDSISGYVQSGDTAAIEINAAASFSTAVGAASGTGAASAVGVGLFSAAGAASGAGAASAAGVGINDADAAASGTGEALAVGAATADSDGASSGVGEALGVGAATADADGASEGVGDAAATGAATADSDGASSGAGEALGVGTAVEVADGAADGTSTAEAVGASTADADGASSGVGEALAVGAATADAVAESSGAGEALAVGAATADADGDASGVGEALAEGEELNSGDTVGSADGVGEALAVGASVAASVGSAVASGELDGRSNYKPPRSESGGAGFLAGTGRYAKVGGEVERVVLRSKPARLYLSTTVGLPWQDYVEPIEVVGSHCTIPVLRGASNNVSIRFSPARVSFDDSKEVGEIVKMIKAAQAAPKKSAIEMRLEALERQMKAFLKGTGS